MNILRWTVSIIGDLATRLISSSRAILRIALDDFKKITEHTALSWSWAVSQSAISLEYHLSLSSNWACGPWCTCLTVPWLASLSSIRVELGSKGGQRNLTVSKHIHTPTHSIVVYLKHTPPPEMLIIACGLWIIIITARPFNYRQLNLA